MVNKIVYIEIRANSCLLVYPHECMTRISGLVWPIRVCECSLTHDHGL